MSSKMLIDAAHPEETRVAVVRGNRLEDFDYESATRKQLKGNIYLARVTRVEPSLQAAFVDYGGNRHGFLAFNEIHPDYYQIPVADRQALIEEEAEEESRAMAEEAKADDERSGRSRKSRRSRKDSKSARENVSQQSDSGSQTGSDAGYDDEADRADASPGDGIALESAEMSETISGDVETADDNNGNAARANGGGEELESVGQEDALEELPVRRARRRRSYKIQEVIKRRQIILVQVVKEERGNKGAALTTYISLAGRYTVLMPNTARGGGISRKITNPTDRKRLRKIAGELDVTAGMGLIIRTAGASRTKAEIKRDFEYLLRMWENIRDLTLQSTAPTLVYEEGNLIKRSIRDLYGKEIDGVLVSGDQAYKDAKAFMKLLMPSHAKNVQAYDEPVPIFVRHQIERQLGAMFSPQVTLKSGGYIVINQTEALVAVDVNSGRSTREHSIEDTALRTNIEAADELARQLRLRDLAGLIVIDFIDMEERRNNRSVERRVKDALKTDRARIQVGRISPFGLLEMSRQRLRAGMLEGTTSQCTVCQGTGIVRSTESVALDILRSLEDTLLNDGRSNLVTTTSNDAALYLLNHKRSSIHDIEGRYGIVVTITANDDFHGANFTIERGSRLTGDGDADSAAVHMDGSHHQDGETDDDGERKRRRRRRGGREDGQEAELAGSEDVNDPVAALADDDTSGEEKPGRRPRRRGRRGGRRNRGGRNRSAEAQGDTVTPDADDNPEVEALAVAESVAEAEIETEAGVSAEDKADDMNDAIVADAGPKKRKPASKAKKPAPKPRKTAKSRKKDADKADDAEGQTAKPKRSPRQKKADDADKSTDGSSGNGKDSSPNAAEAPAAATSGVDKEEEDRTPRSGWWQRRA